MILILSDGELKPVKKRHRQGDIHLHTHTHTFSLHSHEHLISGAPATIFSFEGPQRTLLFHFCVHTFCFWSFGSLFYIFVKLEHTFLMHCKKITRVATQQYSSACFIIAAQRLAPNEFGVF